MKISLLTCLLGLATTDVKAHRPALVAFVSSSGNTPRVVQQQHQQRQTRTTRFMSDDWSSFQSFDDDDDLEIKVDNRDYAKEEDTQEMKAQVGAELEAPTILHDAEPIFVPIGSQLDLDEETVLGVLAACRQDIGTMFGYTAENRGVGITGGFDFVDMDGPTVILSLKGRYWHQRTTVLVRVASYLQSRIPEIIDVIVEDEYQLTDECNEKAN